MLSTISEVDFNQGGYYDNHMSEETFGQRLKRLRLASGLGVRALARAAGIKSHASISQAEAGLGWSRPPSPDVTKPLAKALGVDHSVLLGEDVVVDRPWYETVSDDELMERVGITITPPQFAAYVEGLSMHAGEEGSPIPDDLEDSFGHPLRIQPERGDPIRWYRVFGSCMEPRISDGDWVFIDRNQPIEPGKFVAAVVFGKAVARKLTKVNGRFWLETLDGARPQLVTDGVRIIGRIRHRQSSFD